MINGIEFTQGVLALFKGSLTVKQNSGVSDIVDAFNEANLTDKRQLAYILATVYWETGRHMQPVTEFGGDTYLKTKKYYPYYGRDLVQTTWVWNYQKVYEFSGYNVVKNPELIGQMPLAAKVAVHFMQNGYYTGKKLDDYFNDKEEDWFHARRIINGIDKAQEIANIAHVFNHSILTTV